MIIKVKLKPFSEWPCSRDDFVGGVFHPAQLGGLSGLEIELSEGPPGKVCSNPWREGRAWHITYESIQRMFAVGAIGPYAIVSTRAASETLVCEHMIVKRTLFAGRLLARLRGTWLWKFLFGREEYLFANGPLVNKYFLHEWTPEWSSVWRGSVIRSFGDRGLRIYLVELFPDCEPMPNDSCETYLVSSLELRSWHFYDTREEMENDFRKHTGKPQKSDWTPPIPERPN